jgi:cyclase
MVEWRIEELAHGIFARTGAHPLQPNSGIVVGDDGVLIVDSGYSTQCGRELLTDVRRLTPKPVQIVVISHHHFDHAWGNEAFAGATLVGHANAERLMREDAEAYKQRMLGFVEDPARWYGLDPGTLRGQLEETRITPPRVTFTDRSVAKFVGPTVEILHFGAGHTPGDALVYLPTHGILFGGDLVCNHVLPNALDGDPLNWPNVLAAASHLDVQTVVPGHGPVGTSSLLNEFGGCLAALTTDVQRALDAGAPNPRAASEQLHLGDLAGWSGQELLPGTVRSIYRGLERVRS